MLFSYVVIFLEVMKQRRKIAEANMPFCQKKNRKHKFAREWKPAMLFMAMALIFILSWLPNFSPHLSAKFKIPPLARMGRVYFYILAFSDLFY